MTVQQINLKPNENPPTDVDYVLVLQGKSGTVVTGVRDNRDGHSASFWSKDATKDLQEAMDAALDWAEANGVEMMYVKIGRGDAEGA